jgi:2-polyprenyl-3-methyl-5-hydroxy-6-metoxy-1,4-benzoquinol methylase
MALYDSPYFADNVYGHLRSLLGRVGSSRGGVHLDVGCGFGRVAEALRDELGLTYIGVDLDGEALASLRERGFETVASDLTDLKSAQQAIEGAVAGRPLSSLSILDTLEHLAEPGNALRLLYAIARPNQCPLVVSVPNAAHRDVGFKLAFGRWDYTSTGLLDRTHLRCFTESSITALARETGWHEIDRFDVVLEKSDQHFPALHPALADGTSLNRMLAQLRASVDTAATTNQFVRAYLPGPVVTQDEVLAPTGPFLSVVTRTQGRRLHTLRDALLSLSAQTDQDFEVLVVGHRLDAEAQLGVERIIEDTHAQMRAKTRLVSVKHGNRTAPLNAGFAEARGSYVAILDDDDFVFANWVETFRELARAFPGRVLRAGAVAQIFETVSTQTGSPSVRAATGFERRFPREFDLLEHLVENRSPPVGLAFPRLAFADLNIRFDEALTTTEDWDFLLRTAAVCDVASSATVTGVYRQWEQAESSFTVHSRDEWQANHTYIWRKLDRLPILLPEGSAARIRNLLEQARHVPAQAATPAVLPPGEVQALRDRASVILRSRSWRLTAPLRFLPALFGRKAPKPAMVWSLDGPAVHTLVRRLERSVSWRLTGLIRRAKKLLAS